jgi:hypothetical protein
MGEERGYTVCTDCAVDEYHENRNEEKEERAQDRLAARKDKERKKRAAAIAAALKVALASRGQAKADGGEGKADGGLGPETHSASFAVAWTRVEGVSQYEEADDDSSMCSRYFYRHNKNGEVFSEKILVDLAAASRGQANVDGGGAAEGMAKSEEETEQKEKTFCQQCPLGHSMEMIGAASGLAKHPLFVSQRSTSLHGRNGGHIRCEDCRRSLSATDNVYRCPVVSVIHTSRWTSSASTALRSKSWIRCQMCADYIEKQSKTGEPNAQELGKGGGKATSASALSSLVRLSSMGGNDHESESKDESKTESKASSKNNHMLSGWRGRGGGYYFAGNVTIGVSSRASTGASWAPFTCLSSADVLIRIPTPVHSLSNTVLVQPSEQGKGGAERGGEEEKQDDFTVYFTKQLGEKLGVVWEGVNIQGETGTFVQKFYRADNGDMLCAEASGKIQIGDQIIGIMGKPVEDLTLNTCASELQMYDDAKDLNLTFRRHGRAEPRASDGFTASTAQLKAIPHDGDFSYKGMEVSGTTTWSVCFPPTYTVISSLLCALIRSFVWVGTNLRVQWKPLVATDTTIARTNDCIPMFTLRSSLNSPQPADSLS